MKRKALQARKRSKRNPDILEALTSENARLQRQIVKLQAEAISKDNKIKVLESELGDDVRNLSDEKLRAIIMEYIQKLGYVKRNP